MCMCVFGFEPMNHSITITCLQIAVEQICYFFVASYDIVFSRCWATTPLIGRNELKNTTEILLDCTDFANLTFSPFCSAQLSMPHGEWVQLQFIFQEKRNLSEEAIVIFPILACFSSYNQDKSKIIGDDLCLETCHTQALIKAKESGHGNGIWEESGQSAIQRDRL